LILLKIDNLFDNYINMEVNFNLDTDSYTTAISKNKYHEDDIIDEFIEFVRYTKKEEDAIKNI